VTCVRQDNGLFFSLVSSPPVIGLPTSEALSKGPAPPDFGSACAAGVKQRQSLAQEYRIVSHRIVSHVKTEAEVARARPPIAAPERLGRDRRKDLEPADRTVWHRRESLRAQCEYAGVKTNRYETRLHHPRFEYVCKVPAGSVLSAAGSSP
jgi:hypothetical protein